MPTDTETPAFTVGIVLYPEFDLLDIAGPYDVFTFFDGSIIGRDVQVVTVAEHQTPTFRGIITGPSDRSSRLTAV